MDLGDDVVALSWDRPATGGHGDLVLKLGDWSHRCDSYYLALEAEDGPGRGAEAVVNVMQALLRQWRDYVRELADSAVIYLPYDLSDQATCWLQVQRSGTQLEVAAGWSSIEGFSFMVSDFSAVQPNDWQKIAEAPVVVTTMEDWDRAVAASSARLEAIPPQFAGTGS